MRELRSRALRTGAAEPGQAGFSEPQPASRSAAAPARPPGACARVPSRSGPGSGRERRGAAAQHPWAQRTAAAHAADGGPRPGQPASILSPHAGRASRVRAPRSAHRFTRAAGPRRRAAPPRLVAASWARGGEAPSLSPVSPHLPAPSDGCVETLSRWQTERGEVNPRLAPDRSYYGKIKARDLFSRQVRRAGAPRPPFFYPGFLPGTGEALVEVWGPLPEWARPVSVSPPTLAAQTSSVWLDLSSREYAAEPGDKRGLE